MHHSGNCRPHDVLRCQLHFRDIQFTTEQGDEMLKQPKAKGAKGKQPTKKDVVFIYFIYLLRD